MVSYSICIKWIAIKKKKKNLKKPKMLCIDLEAAVISFFRLFNHPNLLLSQP